MPQETTIHKRPITDAEKAKMRKSHWVLIPVLLIPLFIIWIVSKVDTLPQPAQIGAYVIGFGVVIVFAWKQLKLDQDLRIGEVEVVRGVVENKTQMGGRRGTSTKGGGRSAIRSKNSQTTNIITLGGKKYWVRTKIYKQAELHAYSEMVWLPESKYVISINKI